MMNERRETDRVSRRQLLGIFGAGAAGAAVGAVGGAGAAVAAGAAGYALQLWWMRRRLQLDFVVGRRLE